MSEFEWQLLAFGVGLGLLLGRWWAGWAIWGYLWSKTPDVADFRTAFFLRGKMFYIVTDREYVNKVMGPLPGGIRMEIGDNYTRFSHGMPPREGL